MADRDWVKVFSLAQKKYPRLGSIPLSEINIETFEKAKARIETEGNKWVNK